MKWFIAALEKYADFTGRARRMEYWMFTLFSVLVGIGLVIVCAFVVGLHSRHASVVTTVYSLGIIVPGLAVTVRRLHDTGRSGWWWFLNFVPIIGSIVLLVLMCIDGTPGDNEYGVNPKWLAA